MKDKEYYKELAHKAIDYALAHGCNQARAEINYIENFNLDTRNMEVDSLQQSTSFDFTLRLYIQNRYGSISTNRVDNEEELFHFIGQGIDTTQYLSEDAFRTLPDPARYYKASAQDTVTCFNEDVRHLSSQEKINMAIEAARESEDFKTDVRIISAETSIIDRIGWQYMCDSQDFEGESEASICYLSASVTLEGEGDSRPNDYWSSMRIGYKDLNPKGIMTTAINRALAKRNQKPVESGEYTVIVEAQKMQKLLNPLLDVLYGSSLDMKRSFLIDKLNQPIASNKLTIMDKPLLPGAIGTSYFDFEGVATHDTDIIRNGVLKTYFIDTYYSHKLGMEPTLSSPINVYVEPGERSKEEMISSQDKAIVITDFNGGNYNEITGDFSFGFEGFLYQNGTMVQAISEMNVSGNLLELWQNLEEVGGDIDPQTAGYIPSMMFTKVKCNGL